MTLRGIFQRLRPQPLRHRRNPLRPYDAERERKREEFWREYNASYERLRRDPGAWNAMLREREANDPALVDPSDWLAGWSVPK